MSIRTYTASFKFGLINYASPTWSTDDDTRWNMLDTILATISTKAPFVTATGTANALTLPYSPAYVSINAGTVLGFQTILANTGAVTVMVNALGPFAVQSNGTALTGGEFAVGTFVRAIFDGVQFQIISPSKPVANSVSPSNLTTGHPSWDTSSNLTVGGSVTAGSVATTGAISGASLTTTGAVNAGDLKTNGYEAFRQADNTLTSAVIFASTSAPSGGNNGDIWLQYT